MRHRTAVAGARPSGERPCGSGRISLNARCARSWPAAHVSALDMHVKYALQSSSPQGGPHGDIDLRRHTIPGASLYRLYVGALAACLVGNLVIRVGAEGGWLPRWGAGDCGRRRCATGRRGSPVLAAAAARSRRDAPAHRARGAGVCSRGYVPLAALYVNLSTASAAGRRGWTRRISCSLLRCSRPSASSSRGGGCNDEQAASAALGARLVAGRSRGPARRLASDDQRARARLIRSSLPLAFKIARLFERTIEDLQARTGAQAASAVTLVN